jgi:ECF sigma factor
MVGLLPRCGVESQGGEITKLLTAWRQGDRAALDELWALIRPDLLGLARRRLDRERRNHTIQLSSLVPRAVVLASEQIEHIVALDPALKRLAKADERKSRVFETRFFGGVTVEMVAEALSVAPNTVIGDWNFARAWVKRELGNPGTIDRGTLATD